MGSQRSLGETWPQGSWGDIGHPTEAPVCHVPRWVTGGSQRRRLQLQCQVGP